MKDRQTGHLFFVWPWRAPCRPQRENSAFAFALLLLLLAAAARPEGYVDKDKEEEERQQQQRHCIVRLLGTARHGTVTND